MRPAELNNKLKAAEDKVVSLEAGKKKLEAELQSSEQRSKLWEEQSSSSAAAGVSYAVALLKSHIPDLDLSLLTQSFNCETEEQRDALVADITDAAQAFVDKYGLTPTPPEETDV